jgi:hypothetical protein
MPIAMNSKRNKDGHLKKQKTNEGGEESKEIMKVN